ncbi:MAG: Recombination protein RecR [Candidatus Magasanikbacteria bacterium GW2011_GWA2_40_10]|uniref:Recombination protein RecR n=1 Tax=Candidatus Magasanikbacteria bacterium GW2011_GWA2_40_10 TaxID=1619037 RepID=A0A0G0QAY2_9BACT|nr:MAG: Recombination protein RecR [Candidatus Magasanikbacteria bacterium GW2011_GWA2_40_10]
MKVESYKVNGMYSKSIQNLIGAFRRLPTVGQRTAERFVFYLLKSGKKEVGEITLALKELIENVKSCEICWDFSDNNPCAICNNKTRDTSMLCVVSEPQDIPVIERTGAYKGLYHVLRGLVEAGYEERMEKIKIKELFKRIGDNKEIVEIKEIILALNPDLSGETTMLFLERKIKEKNPDLKVTRLARGLPMGSDLQYADEITLGSAIKNRMVR